MKESSKEEKELKTLYKKSVIFVLIALLLISSIPTTIFADDNSETPDVYTYKDYPGIPEAVDPGTPEYSGEENPVPEEPVPYDPSSSMLEDIYDANLAAGGEEFWFDEVLERTGAAGGTDLFTRGRALYMFVHNPSVLGFAGGYAYREMPSGSERDMYTITLSDTSLSEDSSERKQYPSHWTSEHHGDDVSIEQKKFITHNNVAVTILNMTNTSDDSLTKMLTVSSPLVDTPSEDGSELTGVQTARFDLTTMYPRLSGDGLTVDDSDLTRSITLEPGESTTVKIQMGVTTEEIPESTTDYERFAQYDPNTAFSTHLDEYNQFWHENVPYIDIDDENIKKMSYYRTFLNRFNYLDANIPGNDFQFPVSIEGVLGYNNAIQLTQPMHMQDLKYFRDPLFSYGNWVSSGESSKFSAFQDNPGDPNNWNNTYAQWIADEAWESYKVHGGDLDILENLARYTEGDIYGQLEKYDTEENYLVQYDWGSLTGNDADAVALNWRDRDQDRTDQSSFNYSGARAAAEIYEILGNEEKAQEMTELADNIQQAMLDILWDDSEGDNGKVFKQRDIESGELVPWKDQQNWSPFTHGVVPTDTDEYIEALRFYADAEQFPIMPFFTANQYDKQLAVEAGRGGTNNFSNINSTLQSRLFSEAIREYPSEYISPEMYRKLIEWLTWTQYIDGDNRYPNNEEFWNSYNEETQTIEYRSWIPHNILGAYNFSIIEDIAGMQPRLDDTLELWPINMGYEYFTVNNLRYHDSDLTIVWDEPNGTQHYENAPEGYSVYLDGQLVFTVSELVHLTYDPTTGDVIIEDENSDADILFNEAKEDTFKEATDVSLTSNERTVDMFQKAGVDLSEETGGLENLARGKDVSASYTAVGSNPEDVTAAENAVNGFTVSGLPTTRGSHYAAPNPIWGTKGSPNEQDWFEVDFGEETSFDNVKLYFYNDKHENNYREPLYYMIQYYDGSEWVSVPNQKQSPLQANFNEVKFNTITAEKMRVLMTPYPGIDMGLKEIQVFETGIEVPIEENQAPEVEIFIDSNFDQPMQKQLYATVRDDGQEFNFPELTWDVESGPGTVIFSDPNSISTIANFSEEGTYTLSLSAFDGEYTTTAEIEVAVEMTFVNLARSATPSTSFVSSWEDLNAINNGIDPESSTDKTGGAYGNWNHPSETQWVQYTWEDEVVINQSDVYWWTDGGGIQMPQSYELEYLDSDGNWQDVEVISGLEVEPDEYNTTTFEPVKTTALRMTITRGNQWTGILEWKVFEPPYTLEPEDVKVRVMTEEEPELPETVTKVYNHIGITQEVGVTWESLSEEQLEETDVSYDISGALDSSHEMIQGTVYIRSEPRSSIQINTVEEKNLITLEGNEPRLPSFVEVLYNDGSRDNLFAEVTWDSIDPSEYSEPGEFTVEGTVEGTNLPAVANITVLELWSDVSRIIPKRVTTNVGVEPDLPSTVSLVLEDDSTIVREVTWDSIDPSEYEEVGEFTVSGSVFGTDIEAEAHVTVELTVDSFNQLLDEAKDYSNEYYIYTEDSFGALQDAIETAESLDLDELSEEELYDAYTMLQSAIDSLEEIARTFDNLAHLTETFIVENDAPGSDGIINALVKKLENAEKASDQGDTEEANDLLQSYIDQVISQTDRSITAEQADVFIWWAEQLMIEE